MMRFASSSTSARSSPETCPGGESGACSTNTTSAPRALIIRALSGVFPLDITATKGYPFTAHTMASPVPVFPLVVSTMVCPDLSSPEASASSMIFRAILSFMLKPGFKSSSFA